MQDLTEKRLAAREKEIKSILPWKGGVFLPTDKLSLEERVRGLEDVLRIWEGEWPNKHSHQLRALRNKYRDRRRCFIIGNGPSLNETDLNLLTDEITFGVNGIFLKFPETPFRPTFYVVEDHLVAEDCRDEINNLTGPLKLFPIYLGYCLREGPNTIFFNHRGRPSAPHGFDFSTDASKITYAGCTVTFTCMQLAFYFGFEEIYLVGVDHSYEIPKDVEQQNTYGTQIFDMSCEDPNHFCPTYFGKGKRWHDPQLEKQREAYKEALRVTQHHGVKLFNATVGGRLEIFPRVDYYSLFGTSNGPLRATTRRAHLLSLDPGLTNSLGHRSGYQDHLSLVCKQRRVPFLAGANARVAPDLLESYPYLRAVFTDTCSKSGIIKGPAEPAAATVERFRREVEDFLDRYLAACEPGDRVILYLYTGGLPHIDALHDIIKGRPQISAHINLFWCRFEGMWDRTLAKRWAETLRRPLHEDRMAVTVPTREMQSEIRQATGVVLPVAPAPSTTFDDLEARNTLERSEINPLNTDKRANWNVLFPSVMNKTKGYDLSISLVRMLSKMHTGTRYHCTLRYATLESTPREFINDAETIRGSANIVEGMLPPDEFQRMLKEADIIVLPYQPSEFSNQTSGLLIDALLCGVPVVVQEGTWLGNVVARYDCGIVVEKASPKAYAEAIELVAANHRHYRTNAISAGKEWLDGNSWAALLDFILEPAPPFDVPQGAAPVGPQERRRNVLGKVGWGAATKVKGARDGGLCHRLIHYLAARYPSMITIGRFGMWSLAKLRRTFLGIGGTALLAIGGLYVAGALIGPARWYLVGIATALLLLGAGLLAVSYVRLLLNDLISSQRRTAQSATGSTNRDLSLLTHRELDELAKIVQWRTIKNLYRGQRAFIIGNGPSLNRTPLHLLKDEFTLCFNRFDLMWERLGWRPTMYMCVDDRVAENTASRINEIIPLVKSAFLPDIHPGGMDFRDLIVDAHNVFWLSLRWGGFYDDLPACGMGGTVVHAGLQVLAFMGFSPIYLVGVDLEFKGQRSVIKHDQRNWTATQDDDLNHFDPRYFGAGAKFHYPRVHENMLPSFQRARERLDAKGIEVLNAGIGGALEVFPRVDFRRLFDYGEDVEADMLLSAIPSHLQPDARDALRGHRVIEMQDDWDERSPVQVTTLQLAEQLIPKVIFTHIPYGPFGNRYLFIRREESGE